MARIRHLSRAPITEAVIDIRVEPRPELLVQRLLDVVQAPEAPYYVKGPIVQGNFEATLALSGKTSTSAASEVVGVRLHSKDERYVMQWQRTGFTLSRLSPYEGWQPFLREARRLWLQYVGQAKPIRVVRLSTRYINQLRLPLVSGESFQNYFLELVDLPKGPPQAVEAFLQRFQLRDTQRDAQVLLSAALATEGQQVAAPVILDIDAIMTRVLAINSDELWDLLEQLHTLKNETFFGVITERTAELFE